MVEVFLTEDAQKDLDDLYQYIFFNDSPASADHVLEEIEIAITSLKDLSERGAYPDELLELGIKDFRQVYFKPYRIIYKQIDKRVYVILITDGRRDMQTLLSKRLLEG